MKGFVILTKTYISIHGKQHNLYYFPYFPQNTATANKKPWSIPLQVIYGVTEVISKERRLIIQHDDLD